MTADFDTIRSALQLHIRGAASLNDWKMASDALARVQAASEQAEKVLAAARSIAEHLEDGGFSVVSSEDDAELLWELHLRLYKLTDGMDTGCPSDVAAPGGVVKPAGTPSLPDACEVVPSSSTGAATQDDVIGAMQRGMTDLFERLARVQAAADEAEKALTEISELRDSHDIAGAALSLLRKDTG